MVALIGVLLLLGAAPAVAQDAGEAVRRDSPFDGNAATTERIGAESVRAQAIAISAARFADGGAVHVVVSRDDVFADSLAGTALLRDGPLLLVAPNGVPSETLAELTRVLPQGGRVYLLGGANAIAPAFELQLVNLGYDVQRLAGASRVETSVAVAREVLRINPDAPDLVIARADAPEGNPTAAWADSVAVGGWTAWTRSPIVLTPSAGVHPAVAVLVQTMAPSRTVLLGGTAALSPAVEQAMPNPQRLAGANRADTAVVIARDLWPGEAQRYAVINGYDPDGWAHGLPAAGLSADAQAPLLVAQAGSVPQETLRVVSPACGAAAPVDVLVLGGEAQLNAHLVPQLDGSDPSACAAAPACHQSYPDFCVAPPPPDLNCGDIADTNFTVLPPDPHDFDGNQDGVGCES